MKFKFQTSLRQKITLGYYVVAILILGVSALTFEELRKVEEKIFLGERISELFDTTLEVRRFERNYFLHGQDADYLENVRYLSKIQDLLEKDKNDFAVLVPSQRIVELRDEVQRYAGLMQEYARVAKIDPLQNVILELRIRSMGKSIVAIAEGMNDAERRLVQSSLTSFRQILALSIAGVALLMIVVGQALSRRVVHPLKAMEYSVNAISCGKRDKLLIPSRDREIVSIIDAFNHMLRELELRQKYLLRSEKLASLGTMLSGVAHELNNPLSNISSSCQILMEEIEERDLQAQRSLLEQMDEQTMRARNIVRSLLDFARDRQFSKEPLPLEQLIQQTLRFIRGEVPTKVAISVDIPADIVVFADKQRLQQAFLNLIKNAMEVFNGEGTILISARRRKSREGDEDGRIFFSGCRVEGDSVDITVMDNGPGIASDILPRIFDPFFTTKDVGQGLGLGLFIVYEIVDEHNGCISVSSEIGKGATFLVRLPAERIVANDN